MKHILIIIGCAFSLTAFAQKEVVSAYNANKDGDYREAAIYIEQAILIEKSKVKAKTWKYRGDIYLNIAKDSTLTIEFPDALRIGKESYETSQALDLVKERYKVDNILGLNHIRILSKNKAIKYYQSGFYDSAAEFYQFTYEVGVGLGEVDTINIYSAALCYANADMKEEAIENYKMCYELEYYLPFTVLNLSQLYVKSGDVPSALSVLQGARLKYPNEVAYITEEFNVHIGLKDQESALKCIIEASERDTTNYQFWTLRGNIFQGLNDFDNSKFAFETAYDLDSTKFAANFGLGILYNNKASEDFDLIDDFPYKLSTKQSNEMKAIKARGYKNLSIAIEYLEVAHLANPNDLETIVILKGLYVKTGEDDKYFIMTELFEEIRNK